MKKILWLPAWYPNSIDLYTGDFILRHAKAVSLFHFVQVIYVIRDREGKITENIKEDNYQEGRLNQKIIYYHTPVFPVSIIDKIISNWRYRTIYLRAVKEYIRKEGIPFCTHVHVINKNGLIALWLNKKYSIPFVISEHWTVYLKEAIPGFLDFHWLVKFYWHKIIKASKAISVVSLYLGEAISRLQKNMQFTVIPNVIDHTVFFPSEKKQHHPVHFIHISTLGFQKNPESILQAFALVNKINNGFVLSVVGPPENDLNDLAISLGLQDRVFFYTEVPQLQLAGIIQQSHALILYSRYETFGCVLIEANACGVPAIVSDIPVFHEIIEEGINGYFVPGENAAALAKKIIWFMEQSPQINTETIAGTAKEKYNYETVGKLFSEFYKAVL